MPCLSKQCRPRSVGFFRSQLIWICTVCQLVCEFLSAIWIKWSDWLKIRSGRGILIYSAWQGLNPNKSNHQTVQSLLFICRSLRSLAIHMEPSKVKLHSQDAQVDTSAHYAWMRDCFKGVIRYVFQRYVFLWMANNMTVNAHVIIRLHFPFVKRHFLTCISQL